MLPKNGNRCGEGAEAFGSRQPRLAQGDSQTERTVTEKRHARSGLRSCKPSSVTLATTLGVLPRDDGSPVAIVKVASGGGGQVSIDDERVYWSIAEGIFNRTKSAHGPFQL